MDVFILWRNKKARRVSNRKYFWDILYLQIVAKSAFQTIKVEFQVLLVGVE